MIGLDLSLELAMWFSIGFIAAAAFFLAGMAVAAVLIKMAQLLEKVLK